MRTGLLVTSLATDMKSPDQLQRNDVAGAMQVWLTMLNAGTLTPDVAHTLLRMQDDSSELQAAWSSASAADPSIAAKVEAVSKRR